MRELGVKLKNNVVFENIDNNMVPKRKKKKKNKVV